MPFLILKQWEVVTVVKETQHACTCLQPLPWAPREVHLTSCKVGPSDLWGQSPGG